MEPNTSFLVCGANYYVTMCIYVKSKLPLWIKSTKFLHIFKKRCLWSLVVYPWLPSWKWNQLSTIVLGIEQLITTDSAEKWRRPLKLSVILCKKQRKPLIDYSMLQLEKGTRHPRYSTGSKPTYINKMVVLVLAWIWFHLQVNMHVLFHFFLF